MKTTSWIPMGVRILQEEGIPEDTLIINVTHTGYWLKLKRWKSGNFEARLCQPERKKEKILFSKLSLSGAKKLLAFSLMPRKAVLSIKDFTKLAQNLTKSKKGLRSVKPKKSKNPEKTFLGLKPLKS